MMISEKYKSIWLVPEGCESKYIFNILKEFEFHGFNGSLTDYSDYTIISNIKNPYFRVYDLYKKQNLRNVVIKKNLIENVIKNFNEWIDINFTNKKFLVTCDLKTNIQANKFVRIDNLWEDISKVDFLSNLTFGGFDTKEIYFDNLYKISSAKKVFEHYKKYFYLLNYDPFSFNSIELKESEKIKFIHDIF